MVRDAIYREEKIENVFQITKHDCTRTHGWVHIIINYHCCTVLFVDLFEGRSKAALVITQRLFEYFWQYHGERGRKLIRGRCSISNLIFELDARCHEQLDLECPTKNTSRMTGKAEIEIRTRVRYRSPSVPISQLSIDFVRSSLSRAIKGSKGHTS